MLVRPPRLDEAEAVLEVIIARDVADIGRPDYTLQDLHSDWQTPGIELARDMFVVEDADGQLLGYADVQQRCASVTVHPEHEGRGVGTLLRHAVEARQRERRAAPSQVVNPANSAAVEHLRAAGYERASVHRRMRVSLDDAPAPPAAAAVRRLHLDTEGEAAFDITRLSFGQPRAFAAWRAEVAAKSEPPFRLALDDEAGLVGVAVGELWDEGTGFVASVAVSPRARGRGHGRTLLLALFDAFRAAGAESAELFVAQINERAAGLYESVGMVCEFTQEGWERP